MTVDRSISKEDPPITASIMRHVKPECYAEFERLISALAQEAKQFPGYLGTNIFRPNRKDGQYRVIYKFDCMTHFHQWEISKVRADYYAKIHPLLFESPQMQVLTGLETWFALPNEGVVSSPPRYKMAIILYSRNFYRHEDVCQSKNFLLLLRQLWNNQLIRVNFAF